MELGEGLRRLVHMSMPVLLVYYWLPDPILPGSISKPLALMLILIAVLLFEIYRLRTGMRIVGMRPYEEKRVSAAAWAAVAIAIALLFFPLSSAGPAFFGMAWVDPLCGVLRRRKSALYPALPLVVYFLLALAVMGLIVAPSLLVAAAAAVGAPLAILFEGNRVKKVDDDFTMIIVPMIAMAAVLLL